MALEIVELQDDSGQAAAEILATQGFNCFRLKLMAESGPVEVLWASDEFRTGNGRASSSGIPILFPFPGRIAGGQFEWEGRSYSLEANDGIGNAIHGFVHTRPWTISSVENNRVVAHFESAQFAEEIEGRWPTDFRIQATYELFLDRLTTSYEVSNPSDQPLPFGLGLHPYFRTGDSNGQYPNARISVPAKRQWELENLIPTGRFLELADGAALRKGEPFEDMNYDDVFGDLQSDSGVIRSVVSFGASHRLLVEASDSFETCVVYTPPHREAVCIEPYTCLPNPFSTIASEAGGGPAVLPPNATAEFRVEYKIA